MHDSDLEYFAAIYPRIRVSDRIRRTFQIYSVDGAKGENTNKESVGSKASVAEPPGM